MPWTPADAERHTHKADTPARQTLWAKVANHYLMVTGESASHSEVSKEDHEGDAIRAANAAVERTHLPHSWPKP